MLSTIPCSGFLYLQFLTWCQIFTLVKSEVRCSVPKTVDTRKHCKVGLRACNNLPQPEKPRCREGVAEDYACACGTCNGSCDVHIRFAQQSEVVTMNMAPC